MSKVDAMRALREARRAAATAGPLPRVAAKAAAPARAVAPAAGAAEQAVPSPAEAPAGAVAGVGPSAAPELCGHRNIGGRSCTRELDHVKQGTKNHRYG